MNQDFAASTSRVRVRKCRSRSGSRKYEGIHYWRIEQPAGRDGLARVFIYKSHRWAMLNAQRIAHGRQIGTHGLRGFQIERLVVR